MASPNASKLPSRLAAGLEALGLSVPAPASDKLLNFVAELEKWNAAYNLTAVRDPADMVTRHVIDSLSLLPVLASHAGPVLDVGAGAGLPCIPLAIATPSQSFTGIDSIGKKVRFMRHVQRTLALGNFAALEGRVEQLPEDSRYGVITSRAFASLADFFTLTRHLLTADGVWVAMKGKLDAKEQAAIPADVEIVEVRALRVPGLQEERHAVIAVPKK